MIGFIVITDLKVHQFRNLWQVDLSLAKCNLLIGANGSGKTSLLEAMFLLSRGKSFRHHEPKRYISHHQSSCVVWAGLGSSSCQSLAIKKQLVANKSDTLLKVDGMTVKSQGIVSQHLPTLLIDPSSMGLLDEGSGSRRQMLDWLCFHMAPGFYQDWLHHQRLLKQRNHLLKQRNIQKNQSQIMAWDHQLSYYAQALHLYRLQVFESWQVHFDWALGCLLPRYQNQISLHYYPGFDVAVPLDQLLITRLSQDVELGYTRVGAHRADVAVILRSGDAQKLKEQASHVLSRGEKKLLIVALRLSQLMMICQHGHARPLNTPLVLIDDLDAELDDLAVDVLLDAILPLPCQLVISSLHKTLHEKIQTRRHLINATNGDVLDYQMFHVKQGQIVVV